MANTSRYQFLHFAQGVNWQKVDPVLLRQLNALGRGIGKVITIISGFRSYQEQAVLYDKYLHGGNIAAKPGHSQHESGHAVDAVIDGKALSLAVSAQTMRKYGLVAPVKGDYPHTQLLKTAAPSASSPSTMSTGPAAEGAAAPVSPPGIGDNVLPFGSQASAGAPGPMLAGTVQAGGFSPRVIADTWRMIAAQPNASPDSQSFAQLAAQAAGG